MNALRIGVYRICLLNVCLLLTGCGPQRPAHPNPPNIGELGYLDLKAGWRLRVVVPIVRTGGYIVPMITKLEGHTISVTAGKDFVGYETDYYDVQSSIGSAVTIKFRHAEAVVQGKKSKPKQPALALFDLPPHDGFIRIVYLIRASRHDHDMVVLTSTDENVLRDLTVKTMSNGRDACQTSNRTTCVQIPAGVAVIPEEKVREAGKDQWKAII